MVVPGNHHDALVALVAIEKLGAVVEERGGGHAVILENDGPVDELEGPVYAGVDAEAAAHVGFREIPLDFAVPVHSVDDCARGRALLGLSGPVRAGAIGDYQELARL